MKFLKKIYYEKYSKKSYSISNVDLDQTSIDEFNKLRKDDYNLVALVSSKEDESKEIYIYHERSAINTISKELVNTRSTKPKQIVKKKTTTINKIIEESPFKENRINLLTIDIENHEYEALKNFNFKKYEVDVIVAECHDISQKRLEIYNQSIQYIMNTKLYSLLQNNNYKLINWVNSDLIFVKKNFDLQ
jgi:isopentenyldiphosphate isomerase